MTTKRVIGINGWSKSGKSVVCHWMERNGVVWLDGWKILLELFVPGAEGYRQIVNYFGEDFLLKSGKLNQRKLWKFVYSDLNKLKILNFVLQPLLINAVQNKIDASEAGVFVVELEYFIGKNWEKLCSELIWVEREQLENLENEKYFVSEKQVLDIQVRLYPKPENYNYYFSNNSTVSQLEKQLSVKFGDIIRAE